MRGSDWPSLVLADFDFVHLHWGRGRAAQVFLPCQTGLRSSAAALTCGCGVSPELSAGPQRCMSTIVCVVSGAAPLTACSTRVVLTCPRGLPLSRLNVASCATSVGVPLPLSALGVHTGRKCMAPDTRPEPWRLALPAMLAARSSTRAPAYFGTSCSLSRLVWMHMLPSAAVRLMMPRLLQRRWLTDWIHVPCVRRGNMTVSPWYLPSAYRVAPCRLLRTALMPRERLCPPVYQRARTVWHSVCRSLSTTFWIRLFIMCCISFLASGVLGTSRIGWISRWL